MDGENDEYGKTFMRESATPSCNCLNLEMLASISLISSRSRLLKLIRAEEGPYYDQPQTLLCLLIKHNFLFFFQNNFKGSKTKNYKNFLFTNAKKNDISLCINLQSNFAN